jgi:hypothetical protein
LDIPSRFGNCGPQRKSRFIFSKALSYYAMDDNICIHMTAM